MPKYGLAAIITAMDLGEQLVETWLINDRINRYLLEEIGSERLATPLTKGKTVGKQFAHIHSVRLMWIKVALPAAYDTLTKIEGDSPTLEELCTNLEASGEVIATMVRGAVESGGRIKGFKPHVSAFVAYLVSHESNHRAQAEVALRQAGVPLSDKAAYGQWEWGVR